MAVAPQSGSFHADGPVERRRLDPAAVLARAAIGNSGANTVPLLARMIFSGIFDRVPDARACGPPSPLPRASTASIAATVASSGGPRRPAAAGVAANWNQGAYVAAKHGLVGLTRSAPAVPMHGRRIATRRRTRSLAIPPPGTVW